MPIPTPYHTPPRLPEGDDVDVPALFSLSTMTVETPIELEIGPGRGAFIMERSAVVPTHCLLGIEIRRKWASVVNERLVKMSVGERARVVCEDARLALTRLTPDACITRAFVLFPDPWWKKRHQKRLVVVDPLIEQLGRLLVDNGELFVETDVNERADEYEKRLNAQSFLIPAGDEAGSAQLKRNPYEARSNRERRADEDGLPVYRMRYSRRPRPSS